MSADYKPGTLAMVTNGDEQLLAFRVSWPEEDWMSVDDGSLHAVSDVRPLVVLDPEDEATIDRVADAIRDAHGAGNRGVWAGIDWLRTREAIRSLLAQPKPAEPTGLGAVVRCEYDGRKGTAVFTGAGWTFYGEQLVDHSADWHMFEAIDVLADGVQP